MTPAMKRLLATPEEWDFRGISAREVQCAVHYEFARTCPWMIRAIAKWHRTGIPAWTVTQFGGESYAVNWNPKKTVPIGEVLHMPLASIPDEVWTGVCDGLQRRVLRTPFGRLAPYVPQFPKPWLCLPPAIRSALCGAALQTSQPAFECPTEKQDGGLFPYSVFRFHIDWTASETAIKTSFARWLGELYPARARRILKPTGKKAALPYAKLKWLSVLRMHRAGLNFTAATQLITNHQAVRRVGDPHDVLPRYNAAGAYGKAVTDAQAQIALFYP